MSKKSRKKTSKTSKAGAKVAPAKRKAAKSTVKPKARSGPKAVASPLPRKTKQPASSAATQKTLTGPAEGSRAPAFTLPGHGGTPMSLSDFAGRKLVLFFYPRADTPGCTREAIEFTGHADAFAKAGTALLGVSADSPKAQAAFRGKHGLSMTLASDEDHAMLQAYGAWGTKSMYGRTFEGVLRTTLLIDAEGRVARIWRNVKVDGHADEVLEAARKL